MVKTLVIVYIPECKICQIVNEYFEYLNSIKYINYKKIYAINSILKYKIPIDKLKGIKLQTPQIYLIENNSIIALNTAPFLNYAIKYKKTLVNKNETNNFFLKKLMRNE
ncbi:ORF MSV098 hypothetical protein [Melanoplus sanguinipes entomopoxvirus]|uniref:Thioredoxin n=1 Tax=Melanoplus sanguinipes entomopoxvirus TaxID=83191 RepID=Q9YVZ4_MSEPV|nr:ORF MSV098 hypothetical protein [Melanoplus sanguinipes entomopoxvirus]AAC97647.1 ORF MSV098 hypothetical protein [Melanoplus sanguinipes entomopoxvirus 'O']